MRILFLLIFLTQIINHSFGQRVCSEDDLEENLIAYFPLNNNAVEKTGTGFNGTILEAVPTEDRHDNPNAAYLFDGVDDYIHIGDHFDLGKSNFTISCWVNVFKFKDLIPGTNSTGGWIVNKGITIFGTPRRAGYALDARKADGKNAFYFFVGDQYNNVYQANNVGFQPNIWYSLIAIKDNDSIRLYVDNELVGTTQIPVGIDVNTNIPLVFGSIDKLGNDEPGTTYFDGAIDDVRIYDRVLTTEERICLVSDCVRATVNLGEDRIICDVNSIQLDATAFDADYRWQDGSTSPILEVSQSGLYWVKVENSCGLQRDTVNLIFPEFNNVKIPNLFTPNGDDKNEHFIVDSRLLGSSLKVFQRTGKKVYESYSYQNEWDGGDLPSGVYFWIITNSCNSDFKGWVTILR